MDEQDLTQLSKVIADSTPTALEAAEGLSAGFAADEMQEFLAFMIPIYETITTPDDNSDHS